jgi:hypothetical protein
MVRDQLNPGVVTLLPLFMLNFEKTVNRTFIGISANEEMIVIDGESRIN